MENTNTSEIKQENKAVKIIKIVVNVIFYTLIAVLLLFSIANLNKKDDTSVPSLFGRGFTTVQTDSMAGDRKDSFTKNDLIFLNVVTDRNRDKKVSKLKEGDIICFRTTINGKLTLNTHRIVSISEDGKTFYTAGDAVGKLDEDVVIASEIRGIYTGKWVGAGKFFKFLQTSTGFLVCIVLPVLIFFIVELVLFILQMVKYKKFKDDANHEEEIAKIKEENEKLLEEERARIRAEILAEQEAKDNNSSMEESSEETTSEEVGEKEE